MTYKRWLVKLSKEAFYTATVEVEADTYQRAEEIALATIKPDEWDIDYSQVFPEGSYLMDVNHE